VRADGGTYSYTALYPISDDWHRLGITWQAASADGANDGTATLWIDGVVVETLSGLGTDTYQLGRFKLGAWSMASTTTGTLNLDNFHLSQSTPTPTPTATATPTGPQTYRYVYDGDGALVLRIAGEVRIYSPGKHYDEEVSGSVTTVKKYYSLNGQTVAVRTIQGETDTLNWILNDHLSSTSITAAEDGSKIAELRYSAFGEVRFSSGTTPTGYQYTGQLNAEAGLIYYNARFYDPYLNHWVQPDTIIPDPFNPLDWNRYVYVKNNPIRYNDPSGHKFEEGTGGGGIPDEILKQTWKKEANEIRQKHIESNNNGKSVVYWAGLEWNERYILEKADYNEYIWYDSVSPELSNADALHDPVVWFVTLFSLGRLSPALFEMVGSAEAKDCITDGQCAVTQFADETIQFGNKSLQYTFDRHGPQWGFTGNWSKGTGELFKQTLLNHVNGPTTEQILGSFRGTTDAIHFYDPITSLDVVTDFNGTFLAGWQLSPAQITHLLLTGNIQ
jgi:RHS repeat-associated protein